MAAKASWYRDDVTVTLQVATAMVATESIAAAPAQTVVFTDICVLVHNLVSAHFPVGTGSADVVPTVRLSIGPDLDTHLINVRGARPPWRTINKY